MRIDAISLLALSLLFQVSLMPQAQATETLQLAQTPVSTVQSGQIQHYSRKYISFYYSQDYPLNQALAGSFKTSFPRFDYHLSNSVMDMGFAQFLQMTQAYAKSVAGDIAAGKTVANPRFGDKVVSWSETQNIANAAYVFAPHWKFGKIEIDGPYPDRPLKPLEADWKVHAQVEVDLNMELWNLAEGQVRNLPDVDASWTPERSDVETIPIAEVLSAAARYNEGKAESDKIDLESMDSSDRKNLLKELREENWIDQKLKRIERQNPVDYMMDSAVDDISYGSVIGQVQRMSEFLIRAEITDPNMQKDRIQIGFGEGETPQKLGIGLDSSYKIVEYVKGASEPREIGYLKVRELGDSDIFGQPIIVQRDYELGDQVVEYPKAGVGINLRGGLMLNSGTAFLEPNFDGKGLGGGGALDLDFNIGPALNMSELYLILSGGYNSGYGMLELGLQKKWFMRQLIFALGVRGGGSFSEANNGGGITGTAGLHWQASPDFSFGVDTGWRQYSNLSGPLLEGFVRFDL